MSIPMIEPGRHGGTRDGRAAMGMVERAALLGAGIDLPEVKVARKHLAHAADIEADAARLRTRTAAAATSTAAERYYRGDATIDEVLDIAARHAPAPLELAGKVLAKATAKASAAVAAELAKVGDRWVTDALRPVIDRLLEPLDDIAAAIPAHVVEAHQIRGLRTEDNDHRSRSAHARDVQRAWTRLDDLLVDLDDVHDLADAMRQQGLIPVRHARPSEDFRWRRRDRLQGSTRARHAFFLAAHRNGADPGIYTETEVEATDHQGAA